MCINYGITNYTFYNNACMAQFYAHLFSIKKGEFRRSATYKCIIRACQCQACSTACVHHMFMYLYITEYNRVHLHHTMMHTYAYVGLFGNLHHQ